MKNVYVQKCIGSQLFSFSRINHPHSVLLSSSSLDITILKLPWVRPVLMSVPTGKWFILYLLYTFPLTFTFSFRIGIFFIFYPQTLLNSSYINSFLPAYRFFPFSCRIMHIICHASPVVRPESFIYYIVLMFYHTRSGVGVVVGTFYL